MTSFAQPPSDPRMPPNSQEKIRQIKSLVLLPPKVDMFELSAGGVLEPMEDWSGQAKINVTEAIKNKLIGRQGGAVRTLNEQRLPKEVATNLGETWALYDAVESSVIFHTLRPYRQPIDATTDVFEDKIANFDYSLGAEVRGLDQQADAFLLFRGLEQRSTGGRKAVRAGAIVLGLLVGGTTVPAGSGGVVSVALIDARSGAILWYRRSSSVSDMDEMEGSAKAVTQLLTDFPIQ